MLKQESRSRERRRVGDGTLKGKRANVWTVQKKIEGKK